MATPLLVPVIEEGYVNTSISKAVLETYLTNKKLEGIDSIILGCTHYPLVEKEINQVFEGKVSIVNSPLIVVNQIIYQFEKDGKLADDTNVPQYEFYLSDYTDNFLKVAKKFFGKDIILVERRLNS